MSERAKLPARRHARTHQIIFKSRDRKDGLPVLVTFGPDEEGIIREVFIDADKPGSDMNITLKDNATILSIALQHGARLSDFAAAIAEEWVDGKRSGPPITPTGMVIRFGLDAERSLMAEFQRAKEAASTVTALTTFTDVIAPAAETADGASMSAKPEKENQ